MYQSKKIISFTQHDFYLKKKSNTCCGKDRLNKIKEHYDEIKKSIVEEAQLRIIHNEPLSPVSRRFSDIIVKTAQEVVWPRNNKFIANDGAFGLGGGETRKTDVVAGKVSDIDYNVIYPGNILINEEMGAREDLRYVFNLAHIESVHPHLTLYGSKMLWSEAPLTNLKNFVFKRHLMSYREYFGGLLHHHAKVYADFNHYLATRFHESENLRYFFIRGMLRNFEYRICHASRDPRIFEHVMLHLLTHNDPWKVEAGYAITPLINEKKWYEIISRVQKAERDYLQTSTKVDFANQVEKVLYEINNTLSAVNEFLNASDAFRKKNLLIKDMRDIRDLLKTKGYHLIMWLWMIARQMLIRYENHPGIYPVNTFEYYKSSQFKDMLKDNFKDDKNSHLYHDSTLVIKGEKVREKTLRIISEFRMVLFNEQLDEYKVSFHPINQEVIEAINTRFRRKKNSEYKDLLDLNFKILSEVNNILTDLQYLAENLKITALIKERNWKHAQSPF